MVYCKYFKNLNIWFFCINLIPKHCVFTAQILILETAGYTVYIHSPDNIVDLVYYSTIRTTESGTVSSGTIKALTGISSLRR